MRDGGRLTPAHLAIVGFSQGALYRLGILCCEIPAAVPCW
jgi:predicted esterase